MNLYELKASDCSAFWGEQDNPAGVDAVPIAQKPDCSSFLVLSEVDYLLLSLAGTIPNGYDYTYCQEWGLVVTTELIERTKKDLVSKFPGRWIATEVILVRAGLDSLLESVRQTKFSACCPCTIGPSYTSIQCCDLNDETNLLSLFSYAKMKIDLGAPESLMKIRCLMNVDHYIRADEMMPLLAGVFEWGQGIWNKYHAHKDAISELVATINNPDSIQIDKDAALLALNTYDTEANW